MVKLAQRMSQLAESATLAVAAKAARMKAEGVDVVDFGVGEPDFPTPPHVARAGISAIEAGQTRYCKPTSGTAAAKQAVCAKLARENELSYSPEQVIITEGGKMGVYLAMQAVLSPGDEVVIPAPYWVSYPEIAKLAGGNPVFVRGSETNDYKLTPDELRRALTPRTRMVVLNSPCNPSGVTYHPNETRALADVLQDRDLLVLSDEIYDRLVFDGQKALSYAASSPAAHAQTLTLNAGSKTYSMTGWRVGYVAGPREVIKAMAAIQTQSTSGAATFTQAALATALTAEQSAVEAMRVEFERRARHMWQQLTAMPGVRCPRPTGAFYCFPNVSACTNRMGLRGSVEFADRLLGEAHVATVPGAGFGLEGHVRLSFATGMSMIDEGLARMAKFIR